METFRHLLLSYSDKNNQIEKVPIVVKNIDHLFLWPVKYFNQINYICLLSGDTQIDDNKCSKSLETSIELKGLRIYNRKLILCPPQK